MGVGAGVLEGCLKRGRMVVRGVVSASKAVYKAGLTNIERMKAFRLTQGLHVIEMRDEYLLAYVRLRDRRPLGVLGEHKAK